MILWVDAQLSPHLAPWLSEHCAITAYSARHLGLLRAKDLEIFEQAREEGAVILTKDRDFVVLVERLGPPSEVIWITAGNTSSSCLKALLSKTLHQALELLGTGEPLVEISDALK